MALAPNTVGSAVATVVAAAAPPAGTPITSGELTTLWQNIVTKIFESTGGVTSGSVAVTVTSVSGVQTGGGVSGPGTGTGTIS